VYRQLLAQTILSDKHKSELLQRGYSRAEILARGYRTLPLAGRGKLAESCSNGSPNGLVGVPGFWVRMDGHRHFWTLAGSPGLLIPCRAPNGQIRAFRIRPDECGEGGGKYRWLSSTDKPGGTGSGTWCHVAKPVGDAISDESLWIVEGEIKADIVSARLGVIVLSIPGVGSWSKALPDLLELRPNGGSVVVALDADWSDKPQVHDAFWKLSQSCLALNYEVKIALWSSQWKGLDDLIVTGQRPDLHPPKVLPEPTWQMKISSRLLTEVPARKHLGKTSLTEMRNRLVLILAENCPCS
jgi:hypothetical protein